MSDVQSLTLEQFEDVADSLYARFDKGPAGFRASTTNTTDFVYETQTPKPIRMHVMLGSSRPTVFFNDLHCTLDPPSFFGRKRYTTAYNKLLYINNKIHGITGDFTPDKVSALINTIFPEVVTRKIEKDILGKKDD